jgi:hypothetical protein
MSKKESQVELNFKKWSCLLKAKISVRKLGVSRECPKATQTLWNIWT